MTNADLLLGTEALPAAIPDALPTLGIDPGLRIGVALIRGGAVLFSAVYDMRDDWRHDTGRALEVFRAYLLGQIQEHGVRVVGIEAPPSRNGMRGSGINTTVAHVARMACHAGRARVHWMVPQTVRKRAFGNGKLKKEQVGRALARLGITGGNDHTRDAVAVALAAEASRC